MGSDALQHQLLSKLGSSGYGIASDPQPVAKLDVALQDMTLNSELVEFRDEWTSCIAL